VAVQVDSADAEAEVGALGAVQAKDKDWVRACASVLAALPVKFPPLKTKP